MVWVINFIQIYQVPQANKISLVFDYYINSKELLFEKGIARYRIEYEILNGKEIIDSKNYDFEILKQSNEERKISIDLDYNEEYKISSRVIDLNSSSSISDTTFKLKVNSSPYFNVGSIFGVSNRIQENDSILDLTIPIYSRITDTIQLKINIEGRKFSESKKMMEFISNGYNEIKIHYPAKDLRLDYYNLTVDFHYKGKVVEKQKTQFYKVGLFGFTQQELDNIIIALDFVYDGEFSKYMKKFKKLEIAWEQFWKDKDPTPNTEFNEEKEKFLENFQYAVSKFLGRNNKINIMGLIYIKYGSPDYIERGELNFDSKNYEIWYYENINRKFIFIDKYGTGEYDLVPPSLYNDF